MLFFHFPFDQISSALLFFAIFPFFSLLFDFISFSSSLFAFTYILSKSRESPYRITDTFFIRVFPPLPVLADVFFSFCSFVDFEMFFQVISSQRIDLEFERFEGGETKTKKPKRDLPCEIPKEIFCSYTYPESNRKRNLQE